MKKFQNLIENRIKHKNNLLQADMKRVYPLTKKTGATLTLYDQHRSQQASPNRRRMRKRENKSQLNQTEDDSQERAEAGYSSGEEMQKGQPDRSTIVTDIKQDTTISVFGNLQRVQQQSVDKHNAKGNQSVFNKLNTSQQSQLNDTEAFDKDQATGLASQ